MVLKTAYGALFYNFLVGLNIPINSLLSFYAQGGLTGGTASSYSITSYTVNGVAQSAAAATDSITYSGFIVTGGIMFSF